VFGGHADQVGADALPLTSRRDERVEDEGMAPSIPGNVDETDQLVALARADPPEAVALDLRQPVVVEHGVTEPFSVKGVDLGVVEHSSPLERNRHTSILRIRQAA
jgi:hypothetical protein